jgi:hypothetical protein
MTKLNPQKNRTQISIGHKADQKQTKILSSLVLAPNEKTNDFGSILAIARSEACKKEHVKENPVIRTVMFAPDCGVYVAIYELPEQNMRKQNC